MSCNTRVRSIVFTALGLMGALALGACSADAPSAAESNASAEVDGTTKEKLLQALPVLTSAGEPWAASERCALYAAPTVATDGHVAFPLGLPTEATDVLVRCGSLVVYSDGISGGLAVLAPTEEALRAGLSSASATTASVALRPQGLEVVEAAGTLEARLAKIEALLAQLLPGAKSESVVVPVVAAEAAALSQDARLALGESSLSAAAKEDLAVASPLAAFKGAGVVTSSRLAGVTLKAEFALSKSSIQEMVTRNIEVVTTKAGVAKALPADEYVVLGSGNVDEGTQAAYAAHEANAGRALANRGPMRMLASNFGSDKSLAALPNVRKVVITTPTVFNTTPGAIHAPTVVVVNGAQQVTEVSTAANEYLVGLRSGSASPDVMKRFATMAIQRIARLGAPPKVTFVVPAGTTQSDKNAILDAFTAALTQARKDIPGTTGGVPFVVYNSL